MATYKTSIQKGFISKRKSNNLLHHVIPRQVVWVLELSEHTLQQRLGFWGATTVWIFHQTLETNIGFVEISRSRRYFQ